MGRARSRGADRGGELHRWVEVGNSEGTARVRGRRWRGRQGEWRGRGMWKHIWLRFLSVLVSVSALVSPPYAVALVAYGRAFPHFLRF